MQKCYLLTRYLQNMHLLTRYLHNMDLLTRYLQKMHLLTRYLQTKNRTLLSAAPACVHELENERRSRSRSSVTK